jgi:cell division protein FtsW (lipid II flippase)
VWLHDLADSLIDVGFTVFIVLASAALLLATLTDPVLWTRLARFVGSRIPAAWTPPTLLLVGRTCSLASVSLAWLAVHRRVVGLDPVCWLLSAGLLAMLWIVHRRTQAPAFAAGTVASGSLVLLGAAVAARLGATSTPIRPMILAGALGIFVISAQPTALALARRIPSSLLAAVIMATFAASLVLGQETNSAHITVSLPMVGSVQPSDLGRVLLVVWLSSTLYRHRLVFVTEATRWHGLPGVDLRLLASCCVPAALGVALGLLSNDFGPALVVVVVTAVMLAVAGARRRYFVLATLGAVLAGAMLYLVSAKLRGRVQDWLDPLPTASEGPITQVGTGLAAIAHGAWTGEGLGAGLPNLVPAYRTDMLLAAVGEELGLVALACVVSLLLLFFLGGIRIARQLGATPDHLLAVGLVVLLFGQSVLMVAGVLGAVPLTGMPVPFLSVSGSNLVANAFALGLLCALAARMSPGDLPPAVQQRTRTLRLISVVVAVALLARLVQVGADIDGILAKAEPWEQRYARVAMLDLGRVVTSDGVVVQQTVPRSGTKLRASNAIRAFPGGPVYAPLVGMVLRSGHSWGLATSHRRTLECRGQTPVSGIGCPELRLTIRDDAQQAAYAALQDRTGAAVAVDLQTGEILAYVSTPSLDPTALGDPTRPLGRTPPDKAVPDRVSQSVTFPGSVAKLATAIAAVETGVSGLSAPVRKITVDGSTISSSTGPCGGRGIPAALAVSCNPEFARIGAKMGSAKLAATARPLLNQQSTLNGIAVARSQVVGSKDGDYFAAVGAIGVGNAQATPLAILQLTAAVARGGRPLGLTAVSGEAAPEVHLQVTADAAATVAAGMREAVVSGTAEVPGLKKLRAAAKTGTADFAPGQQNAWFAAYAPYDAPRFAVVVLLEPGQSKTPGLAGSRDAGPIATTLLRTLMTG